MKEPEEDTRRVTILEKVNKTKKELRKKKLANGRSFQTNTHPGIILKEDVIKVSGNHTTGKTIQIKRKKIQVMGFVYVPAIQSHFVTFGDGLCAGAAQLKKNIIIWHLELYGQEI